MAMTESGDQAAPEAPAARSLRPRPFPIHHRFPRLRQFRSHRPSLPLRLFLRCRPPRTAAGPRSPPVPGLPPVPALPPPVPAPPPTPAVNPPVPPRAPPPGPSVDPEQPAAAARATSENSFIAGTCLRFICGRIMGYAGTVGIAPASPRGTEAAACSPRTSPIAVKTVHT